MAQRTAAPARSILLVAQFTPPSPLVAARRMAGMVKYLGRAGHRLTVLTSQASGRGPIEGAQRVVRTRDLLASPLNWRRANFQALEGGGGGTYGAPSPIARFVVPDLSLVGWLPFALPAAAKLARNEHFDCVVTSSPPESVHMVGALLRRRGLPWVAELRDGWGFERAPARQWPLSLLRGIDDRLERGLMGRADAAVGVTEPIAADLRERFGLPAQAVPNGFDPELAPNPPEAPLPLDPGRLSIVHTGRMGAADRSPRPVLDGLLRLRERSPRAAGSLELVLAGPLNAGEQELLRDPRLGELVRWAGALPHEGALALQRGADALLLFTETARRGHAPAKLYEYLAAGRPILVLGEGTESARLVEEAGAGRALPADDPEAIAAALERLADQGPESVAGRAGGYAYPVLAERMAAVIEGVCPA